MGVQPGSTSMPVNFRLTCFLWVKAAGLFRGFGFDNLVVAGTREGPLLVFGVGADEINRVAVLCGHKVEVTDLKTTIHAQTFLSVAQDGSICGWSSLDGSCRFVIDGAGFGDFRLAICPWMADVVWLWSVGGGAVLVDLASGERTERVPDYGLVSFAPIASYVSCLAKSNVVVCVTSERLVTYSVPPGEVFSDNVLCELPYSGCIEFAGLEYGIVKYSEHSWAIITPGSIEVVRGELVDVDESDSIAFVEWNSKLVLVFGTHSGVFNVVHLRLDKQEADRLEIDHVDVWKVSDFVARIAFAEDIGIVFASRGRELGVLRKDKVIRGPCSEHVQKKCIYATSCRLHSVLRQNGPKRIEEIHLLNNQVIDSWEFDRQITAIKTRMDIKSLKNIRQLIVGFVDGSVCFWHNETASNYVYLSSLASPVIDIVIPPFRLNGSITTIFIGQRGQCSLFRFKEQQAIFGSVGFPLRSIHYLQRGEILALGYMNGQFELYQIESKRHLCSTMMPPHDSVEIWSSMQRVVLTESPLDTFVFRFPSSHLYFQILQVEKISERRSSDVKLEDFLEKYYNKEVVNSDKTSDSFVLFGCRRIPTLFYPPYRITASMLCSASPYIAATNYILFEVLCHHFNIKQLQLPADESGEILTYMIPIFVEMAFSECRHVGNMTVKTILRHMHRITFSVCQELVSPMVGNEDISGLSDRDKMLLAVVVCVHPNTVPSCFRQDLYSFLVAQINSNTQGSMLSLSILLKGIELWLPYQDQNSPLLHVVLKGITIQKHFSVFENLISETAISRFRLLTLFVSSFQSIASDIYKEFGIEYLRRFINLYSVIIASSPPLHGSLITLELARFGERWSSVPEVADLTYELIRVQELLLLSVVVEGDIYAIGDANGDISLYKKGRLVYTEHLFDDPVSQVSLGKEYKRVLALSSECAKVLDMCGEPRQVKDRKTRVMEEVPIVPITSDMEYHISWKDSVHYTLKPVVVKR